MAIHIRILVTSLSLWVLECCHAATSSHGPSLDSHDAYARADQGDVQKLDFSFTEDTHIDNEDAYICIPVEFPSEEGFVIKYEQFFDPTYVHHALLFGCPEPLDTKQWSCPHGSQFCQGGQSTMYAWGKHAEPMQIPDGVGFRVGGQSNLRWGVLQVHALVPTKSVAKKPNTLVAHYTTAPPLFVAGFLLMYYSAFVSIPPNQRDWGLLSKGCIINTGEETLNAFMFRTHTHEHGRLVSAYLKKSGAEESKLLEERDPQKPQAFVPITNAPVTLNTGDELKFRCKFDTTKENSEVSIGAMHTDEMCNFYLVFYAKKPFSFLCEENGFITNSERAPLQTQLPDTLMSAAFPGDATRAMLGGVAGVAIHRPTGDLFVFHRHVKSMVPRWAGRMRYFEGPLDNMGPQMWEANTFNGDNVIVDKTLIKEDVILRLDAGTGAVLARFGAGTFSMPHGITVTDDGHVWVTDVGLHQVMQFDLYGKLLLTLGDKFKPTEFCKPTQVAVGKDGRVYITDGYCHSRVAVYDPSTKNISTLMGTKDPMAMGAQSGDRDPTFKLPHGIAMHPTDGTFFVADRQNDRVVVLDKNGKFIKVLKKKYGPVYGVAFGKDGSFYITSDTTLYRIDPTNGNILWQTGAYTMGHTVAVHDACGSVYVARTAKDDSSLAMYLTNDAKMTIGPNSCYTRYKGINITTPVDAESDMPMVHAHNHGAEGAAAAGAAGAADAKQGAKKPVVAPQGKPAAEADDNPAADDGTGDMEEMEELEDIDDPFLTDHTGTHADHDNTAADEHAEHDTVPGDEHAGHDNTPADEHADHGAPPAGESKVETDPMLSMEDEEALDEGAEPAIDDKMLDQQPEAEDEMDDGDSSGTLSSIQSSVDGFITALKEKKEDIVPEWADKYTAGAIALVMAVMLAGVLWYKGCLPCKKAPAARRGNDEENQDRVALVDYRRVPHDDDDDDEDVILHTIPNGIGSANGGNANLPEAMSCDVDGWDDEWDDDDVIVKGAGKRAD